MKTWIAAGLAAILIPVGLRAQARSEDTWHYDPSLATTGAPVYKASCASCHGMDGKGAGPLAPQLRIAPADLTKLSRHNKGVFPAQKVFRMIDGREAVTGHGDSDMPIWGDAFLASHDKFNEQEVKAKIGRLVHFLASIQEPPEKP